MGKLSDAFRSRFAPEVKEKQHEHQHPFHMWCNQTSCHGVNEWQTSKHVLSFIFWAVLIVCCLCMAIYQVTTLYSEFRAYPHYDTNIYIDSSSIAWPNVTICNLNRVNMDSAKFEVNIDTKATIWMLGSPMLPYDFPLWAKEVDEYRDAWESYLNSSSPELRTVDALFERLGHNCWITFMEMGCRFGTRQFQCCDYAKPIINREFGLCWSITPPPNPGLDRPQQDVPGSSYGLRIYIRPQLNFYLSEDYLLNNYLEKGIIVSIDYNPYRLAFSNPITITPGKQARISLKPTVHKYTLPSIRMFEMECIKRETRTLEILKGEYDKQNCYFDCVQQEAVAQCNCILLSEHKSKHSICNTTDLYRCYNSTDFAALNLDSERFDICANSCMPTCENDNEILATPTISDFPEPKFRKPIGDRYGQLLFGDRDPASMSEGMRKFLQSLADARAVELKDQIYLNIYFPDRGYTIINSKEKLSIFQLIGNIGGQTGLWLGASFITLVQVFYYIGYGIFRTVYYDKKNKTKNFDEKSPPPDFDSPEEDRSLSRASQVVSPSERPKSHAAWSAEPPKTPVSPAKKRPRVIESLRQKINRTSRGSSGISRQELYY